MALLHASAERTIPAPAAAVYDLLSDYRNGHPRILPPAFSNFSVLHGGVGTGTIIRFTLTVGGRAQEIEARVDEPEPGRVLTETSPHKGAVTRFTVIPSGSQSRLQIETTWEPSSGIAGLIERLVAPRLFRKLYAEELDLIERWAIERTSAPERDN
jgi:Polyketide cyclase / dehydrase and lipid transport